MKLVVLYFVRILNWTGVKICKMIFDYASYLVKGYLLELVSKTLGKINGNRIDIIIVPHCL